MKFQRALVVFEAKWNFPPGTTEIVGVASEIRMGSVASTNVALEWPDPGNGAFSVTPIAMVQPVASP